MIERQPVSTPNVPNPAGAYSQAMVVGDLVFTSGFGPQDPATGQVPEGIAAQTAQVLKNVEAAVVAAGSGMDRLVKATVHLATLADWAEFDRVYRDLVPVPRPVRTTVGSELANILVEVDVVAVRG
jgi:reactive intermediate/imine deaminase